MPRRLIAAVLAGVTSVAAAAGADIQNSWDGVARVVAVGDVHGDYEQFVTLLRDASLIDRRGRWIGGHAHLVQTGDVLDRGPDSRKVMDFLMRLEGQARKAGGAVHSLIGNHEAMNVLGDLRYVVPEEFAAFRTRESERVREALWERLLAQAKERGEPAPDREARARFEAEYPLGWVEHRLAFQPKGGSYGRWIARNNAVIRIGDTLFLHGGLSPKYADFALQELNDRVRNEIAEADPAAALVAGDPEGPLWFRGLAHGDPALAGHLDAVLERHGCRRMVVGHTVTDGLVMPRYGGKLVMIDVGLSRFYGGPTAGLLLEDGGAFALHRGRRLRLPQQEGEPLLRYVREVMALEPDPSRLQGLVERLEAAVSAGAALP